MNYQIIPIILITLIFSTNAFAESVTDSDLRNQRNQMRNIENQKTINVKRNEVQKSENELQENKLKSYAIKKVSQAIQSGANPDPVLLQIASGGIENIQTSMARSPVNTPSNMPGSESSSNNTASKSSNESEFKQYKSTESILPQLKIIIDEGSKLSALFEVKGKFYYVYPSKPIPNSKFRVKSIKPKEVVLIDRQGHITKQAIQ